MYFSIPTLALLSNMLPSVLGAVGATVLSFVVITAVSSYYRFQHIVQQAEDTQPEEMGADPLDVLRVQLARYLAGCARRNSSFSIALVRMNNPALEVRMGAPVTDALKDAVRIGDVTCIYDAQTLAVLMELEPEDSVQVLQRITDTIGRDLSRQAEDWCRVGIASYPGHGLSGNRLLKVANKGLAQSSTELPIIMSELEDIDAEEDQTEEGGEGLREEASSEEESKSRGLRRKKRILDELTGVLKPSAVSVYMQRMMRDFRFKKQKAALFCIGVNNMMHIERFHGEDTADELLAGVSRILQDTLRADDLIGRHEKYAFLVLAKASVEQAEIIGKRISTLIQQSQIESDGKKLKVTITLGVATYPEHGRNLQLLYKAGQKVLDYNRVNDIRAYAVYDPKIHDSMPSKPMRSIKSVQA